MNQVQPITALLSLASVTPAALEEYNAHAVGDSPGQAAPEPIEPVDAIDAYEARLG